MPLREEHCHEVLAVVDGAEYLCGVESSVPGSHRCHHHQPKPEVVCPICGTSDRMKQGDIPSGCWWWACSHCGLSVNRWSDFPRSIKPKMVDISEMNGTEIKAVIVDMFKGA